MDPIGLLKIPILKLSNSGITNYEDLVSIEEPLELIVGTKAVDNNNYKTLSITMRTPGEDLQLIRGFLFSEGIINKITDIENIEFRYNCSDPESTQQTAIVSFDIKSKIDLSNFNRHFYTTSSCGVCGKTSIDLAIQHAVYIPKKNNPVISTHLLRELPAKLRNVQNHFNKSGGIHGCALFDVMGNLLLHAEDVGRHNALDKLVGKILEIDLVPAADYVLVLSGRVSFELMQKAICIGIPIVAAIGAPSSLAVHLAKTHGISLIGFLKEDRANIYCGEERISLSDPL